MANFKLLEVSTPWKKIKEFSAKDQITKNNVTYPLPEGHQRKNLTKDRLDLHQEFASNVVQTVQ